MSPTDNNNNSSALKSTREARGLTLDIVHDATKIPMDVLKAIEEGYSVRILTPFYYRGFIKIYAEFLGLDVGEMYKQYGLDKSPSPTSSATISAKINRKVVQPNIVLEQTQEWIAFVFKPQTLTLIFKAIGFLLLLLLFVKMTGCIAAHLHKKTISIHKQSAVLPQENKINVPQEIKHEAVQAPSVDSKVELAVRAIKNTWIQVKADGNVVFQMTLNKGSMESWSADNRIELSGRNIEQLDMEVNGKHVGSLGGGERRIRKVLITQEGLTVKK